MIKKIFILGLSIILLMGVSGCMGKQQEAKVDVKAEVEKYLKDKYNENFTVTGGGTEGWNAPDYEIYAKPERFPNERVMVRRGKGTGGMIDNYTGILMKSKIDKVMTDMISPIYPKSKVWYDIPKAPLDGTFPEMSVEGYLEYVSVYSQISLTICVSDPEYKTNKDEKAEELRKKFEEKRYRGKFRVFYMLDGKLDIITEDKKSDIYDLDDGKKWHSMKGSLSMNHSYQYLYADWEETK